MASRAPDDCGLLVYAMISMQDNSLAGVKDWWLRECTCTCTSLSVESAGKGCSWQAFSVPAFIIKYVIPAHLPGLDEPTELMMPLLLAGGCRAN